MGKDYFVVQGAQLKCTCGSFKTPLGVHPFRREHADGKKKATIWCNKPMINIRPFGICKITKIPCTPVFVAPWVQTYTTEKTGTFKSFLKQDAKLFCTIPGGIITIKKPGQKKEWVKKNSAEDCDMGCGKKANHGAEPKPIGNNIGNSKSLSLNISADYYEGKNPRYHPYSTEYSFPFRNRNKPSWLVKRFPPQAHHLICCEAMKDDDWAKICSTFGYDIDHSKNGVLLPSSQHVACDLFVPLHKGGHGHTVKGVKNAYVKHVKNEYIDRIKDKAKDKKYCDKTNSKKLIKALNKASRDIWDEIKKFSLTLTKDGKDYLSFGCGCCNFSYAKPKYKFKKSGKLSPCLKNGRPGHGIKRGRAVLIERK